MSAEKLVSDANWDSLFLKALVSGAYANVQGDYKHMTFSQVCNMEMSISDSFYSMNHMKQINTS